MPSVLPETDGIVGESNLAKTGGTQARAVHGTIASDADSALRLNAQARGRLVRHKSISDISRSTALRFHVGDVVLDARAETSG